MPKKKKTKLEKLAEAAEELNQVLGLEPAIETEDATVNELAGKIREASELLVEDDEISEATELVIADLTEVVDEPDEQEEPEDEESGDEEFDEEEDTEDDELEEEDEPEEEVEELTLEDLREEVAGLNKRKDMRIMVQEMDFFEPLVERLPDLKSGKALQGAMLKMLDKEIGGEESAKPKQESEKAEKPKSEKKEKPKKANKKAKPAPGKKSNKALVYEAWKDGETDVDNLHESIEKRVKRTTVRGWINAWSNGRNLPAIAKE